MKATDKEHPGLITIQKFIFLLSDSYYTDFINHLSAINATLPLKLVKTIRETLPAFDTHQGLCKKIYGSFDKAHKQNFNQLASYTFRLSNVLAQNFPDYLHQNIFKIQHLVNQGHGKEANFLADMLLEIATRTDDFQCQIFVLNFLSQQAYIRRDTANGLKMDAQLAVALNREKVFTDILMFTRKTLSEVNLEKSDLEKTRNYLLAYTQHSSPAIRILARHSYLIILYQFDLNAFQVSAVGELIDQLEKDLHNQSHVVFPYLVDLRSSLFFIKLNSTLKDVHSKESEREFEAMTQHYQAIKYWKTFVNTGQLYLTAIQCTRLYDKYQNYIYRPDYPAQITAADEKLIQEYISKCKAFRHTGTHTAMYQYETASYSILLGALLIISGGKNIKAGLLELESVLINYQHVNLNVETDSIFMCLMMGYFALKDFSACAKTFKRYTKNIKAKPVFEDNDIRIHAYFYMSQLLTTQNHRYSVMLDELLSNNSHKPASKAVHEMISYFSIMV